MFVEKTEPFAPVKRLPRSNVSRLFQNVFQANGKTYRILDPADGFPLGRDTMATKCVVSLVAGSDFTNTMNRRRKMRELINGMATGKTGLNDLVTANEAEIKEIQELSEAKYLWAHYLCTLFILGPDEKITDEWNQGMAEEKLNDWSAEGYDRNDFLELAALFTVAYNEESEKLLGLMFDAATQTIKNASTDATGSSGESAST